MILVIGGAYQGKLNYAKKTFHVKEWADGENCSKEECLQAKGIFHLEGMIRRLLLDKEEVYAFAEQLCRENPEAVLICREVGYGIVPMDAFEREYRELVGRIATVIAGRAQEVHRVTCGIGKVIKG